MKNHIEKMVKSLVEGDLKTSQDLFKQACLDKTKSIIEQWNNSGPTVHVKNDGKGNIMVSVTDCKDCNNTLKVLQMACKQYGIPCKLEAKGNTIEGVTGLGDLRNERELLNFLQREINRA